VRKTTPRAELEAPAAKLNLNDKEGGARLLPRLVLTLVDFRQSWDASSEK
jgi:hypothetical protein